LKVIEKTGKTIDEAVELALKDLGVSREEVEIRIINEPTRGFLGFLGGKQARVEVALKDGPAQKAGNLLKSIFKSMQLQVGMNIKEKDHEMLINLEGNELGILIGRRPRCFFNPYLYEKRTAGQPAESTLQGGQAGANSPDHFQGINYSWRSHTRGNKKSSPAQIFPGLHSVRGSNREGRVRRS
jgi:hypothetical protein